MIIFKTYKGKILSKEEVINSTNPTYIEGLDLKELNIWCLPTYAHKSVSPDLIHTQGAGLGVYQIYVDMYANGIFRVETYVPVGTFSQLTIFLNREAMQLETYQF